MRSRVPGRRHRSLLALLATCVAVAGTFLAACGGDHVTPPGTPGTPAPAPSTTPGAEDSPSPSPDPPTELRVAFINLFSPLTLDTNNKVAGETFDERLTIVIDELKAFRPDIVGFNEASRTAYGSAIYRLAKDLKMEFVYARANPWYPGTSKEDSDSLAKLLGFEEGELILSRYPIVGQPARIGLNPRTSEAGEGRAMLHVVVKVPGPMGKVDVFITHLTGGGDRIRRAQAADFASHITDLRGDGHAIVMLGQSDPAGASTYDIFQGIGFYEVGVDAELGTCCRENVIGEQPPLTLRTDYLMNDASWGPTSFQVLGAEPGKRADGTLLYGSDHNGIAAVFPATPIQSDYESGMR